MGVKSEWRGGILYWIFDSRNVAISDRALKSWCNQHFDSVYEKPNDGIIRQRHIDAFEDFLKENPYA